MTMKKVVPKNISWIHCPCLQNRCDSGRLSEAQEWNKHTQQLMLQYSLTLTTVLYKAIKIHFLSVTVSLASVSFYWNLFRWLQNIFIQNREGLNKKKDILDQLTGWCKIWGFRSKSTTQVTVTGERRGTAWVFPCCNEGKCCLFLNLHAPKCTTEKHDKCMTWVKNKSLSILTKHDFLTFVLFNTAFWSP